MIIEEHKKILNVDHNKRSKGDSSGVVAIHIVDILSGICGSRNGMFNGIYST